MLCCHAMAELLTSQSITKPLVRTSKNALKAKEVSSYSEGSLEDSLLLDPLATFNANRSK